MSAFMGTINLITCKKFAIIDTSSIDNNIQNQMQE